MSRRKPTTPAKVAENDLSILCNTLAQFCQSDSMCPFSKGLHCPLAKELRAAYPTLQGEGFLLCKNATATMWNRHIIGAVFKFMVEVVSRNQPEPEHKRGKKNGD